jgi:hypothetical protein
MEQHSYGKAEQLMELVERVLLKYAPLFLPLHDPQCFKEKPCSVELPLLCMDPFAIWCSLRLSYTRSAF